MSESLKIRIELYINYEFFIYYSKQKRISSSFDRYCRNISGYIRRFLNNPDSGIVKYVNNILNYISNRVQLLFGISRNEIFEEIYDFFNNESWINNNQIIKGMKKFYDSII